MSDAIDWSRSRPVVPPWSEWPQSPAPYFPWPHPNGWPPSWSGPLVTNGGTITDGTSSVPPTRGPLSPADFTRPDGHDGRQTDDVPSVEPVVDHSLEAIAKESLRALKEIRKSLNSEDKATAEAGRARLRLLTAYLCGYLDGTAAARVSSLNGFGILFVDRSPASQDEAVAELTDRLGELAEIGTRGDSDTKDRLKKAAAITGLASAIAKTIEVFL